MGAISGSAQGGPTAGAGLTLDALELVDFDIELATGSLRSTARLNGLLGYPDTQALGRDEFYARVHPDDAASWPSIAARAAAGETRFEREFRVVLPDGTVRWIYARGQVDCEGGTPRRIRGACLDITDRKRSEEAARESEERYRALTQVSPSAILVSCGGQYVYANDAAARLLRAGSARELVGRTPYELAPPEYHKLLRSRISQVLEQRGAVPRARFRWLRLDGTAVDVDAAAAWVQWQGEDAVQIVAHDITEEVLVDEALRESRALLADELEDATRLQDISRRLIEADDAGAIYRELLKEAIRLMHADGGSVQQLDRPDGPLRMIACEGFDRGSLPLPARGDSGGDLIGRQVLEEGRRIVVEDVEDCEAIAGSRELESYRRGGVRSVQATPLIARDGTAVGLMSTHWSRPHCPPERVLRLLDVLARQAADLLERHRAQERLAAIERRQSFLLRLSDALRAIDDADGVRRHACRLLGEHLGADRVHWAEPDDRSGSVAVASDWHRAGLRSYAGGPYRACAFDGTPMAFRGAQSLAVDDTHASSALSESARVTCGALAIGAFVAVPLKRGERILATLSVLSTAAREWTADDVALVEEVADRVWTAAERARAERALKESRTVLQAFYDSSPLMMGVAELHGGTMTSLEANQATARFFGIDADALRGRRTAELNLSAAADAIWLAHYRRALYTRRAVRFEYEHETPDGPRWIAAIVVCLGADATGRARFSFVADDVTERKRVEAMARETEARRALLLSLDEALQPLSRVADVQREGCRVVRRLLGADRMQFAEAVGDDRLAVTAVDADAGTGPGPGYVLLAEYGADEARALRAGRAVVGHGLHRRCAGDDGGLAEVAARADVPLAVNGTLVALLSAHRAAPGGWSAADVGLLEDAAERIWAASERARAHAAVRESEDKYRSLFSAMDQGYCLAEALFDGAGRCVDLLYLDENAAAVRMAGGESFVGRRLSQIGAGHEPHWYEVFGRVATTGRAERFERRAARDGRWYDFYVFKVGGFEQRRVAVIFLDIGERKRREADAAFLSDIERVFLVAAGPAQLMALAGARIGAYLNVDSCDFCDVDDAHDRIAIAHRWRRTDLREAAPELPLPPSLGEEFRQASRAGETIVIDDAGADRRAVAAACAGLGIRSMLSVPYRPGGPWTQSLTVTCGEARAWDAGEVELFSQVARRLFPQIERARVEAALRESEQRFRTLIENVRDYAIFMLDADGYVIEWSDGAARVKGYAAADVLGKHVSIFYTPEDVAAGVPQRELEEAERVGRAEREGWRVCRNGRRIWVNEIATEVRGPDGVLRGFTRISRDLTDRRRVEQALLDAARHKDEFLAMLSHELRNPLAPIRNSVYLLRHVRGESEAAQHAQGVIERQTRHLARLVDDLLDVTRIARGKIELRRDRVELRELVRGAGEDFRAVFRDRDIGFHVALPDAIACCAGDATRLNQAVGNLLTNAAKFTRAGDQVALSLDLVDGEAVIRVRDTGLGIEPDLVPHLFDPFVQGRRTLARSEGGLGLGLALVKGITELHGGHVAVASAGKGMGSEFTIFLPLVPAEAARAEPRPAGAGDGRRLRVLVVDDNADAAESLAAIIQLLGHFVEIAYDGPSALARVRSFRPDVVMCDIGLPGMTGYEVARALRAEAEFEGRLIAVSGYAQPDDVRRGVEAGFDGHLAKPFDPEGLERLLG